MIAEDPELKDPVLAVVHGAMEAREEIEHSGQGLAVARNAHGGRLRRDNAPGYASARWCTGYEVTSDDEPIELLRSPELDAARAEFHRWQAVFDGFWLHYYFGGGPGLKASVRWAAKHRGQAFERMVAIDLALIAN